MGFLPWQPWRNFGRAFGRGVGGGGINYALYTLYDTFAAARSAGAVNGTPAEPTGQTRTVTDTNSKLSITGGMASFATGGVGNFNPGLKYPAMARVPGLMLMAALTPSSGSNNASLGWDIEGSGAVSNGFVFGGGLALRYTLDGLGTTSVSVFSNGVTYQVAVILRATGTFCFIKGGAFTFWTLIFVGLLGISSPLFPSVIATDIDSVFTADNIRIPINLYIPVPLAYDTFTRANGALGSTETTGPDGQALAALAWHFTAGIWTIVSNAAVGSPASGADAIVNGGFASGANWSLGAGWAIAAGLLTGTAASSDAAQNPDVLTVGRWYRCAYTVSAFAAGTVQLVVGGAAFPTHAANATYTETGRAVTAAYLFRGAGWTGSVDNASALVLTTAELFSSVLVSSADVIYDVEITLPAAAGGVQGGIVCNLDSTTNPQNFIIVYLDGRGNLVCEECAAGVYTTKFTTAVTYSAGAVLRVIRDGTSLRAFYDNAAVSTVQTMAANSSINVGNFSTSPLVSFDNVAIWPRGTGGEYEGLSVY